MHRRAPLLFVPFLFFSCPDARSQETLPQRPIRDWTLEVMERTENGAHRRVAQLHGDEAHSRDATHIDIVHPSAVFYHLSESGANPSLKTLTFRANIGQYDTETQILDISEAAHLSLNDGTSVTKIDAPLAVYDHRRKRMEFRGGVHIGGLEGSLEADCTTLLLDTDRNVGWLSGPPAVRLRNDTLDCSATEIALVGGSQMVLLGSKTIHLKLKDGGSFSVSCRGNATVLSDSGEITLSDDCTVRGPDLELHADRMRVIQHEAEQTTLTAWGNVCARRREDAMVFYADLFTYATSEKRATLRALPYVRIQTGGACHFWGPTTLDESTGQIEATPGPLPMYSVVFNKGGSERTPGKRLESPDRIR